MEHSYALILTLGLFIIFCGWGIILNKIAGLQLPISWLPGGGVLFCLTLGGPMVLAGLATDKGIGLLMLIGFSAVIIKLLLWRNATGKRNSLEIATARLQSWKHYIGILPSFIYVSTLFLLPSAMNLHDDLEKYLKHPVRLLATGSLDSGPFDALGESVLGGMTFLQSMPLLIGSLQFIPVIDGIIAPICILLIFAWCCQHLNISPLWTIIGMAFFLAIDPMVVNISAVYMIALPLVVLFSTPILLRKNNEPYGLSFILLFSLSYAALITVKSSSAFFVPLHFSIAVIVFYLARTRTDFQFKSFLLIPFAVLGITMPWFLSHAEKLYTAVVNTSTFDASQSGIPLIVENWNPLSNRLLYYAFNVTSLQISCILIALFGILVILIFQRTKQQHTVLYMLVGNALSVFLFFTWGMLYLAPRINGVDSVLRYVIPFLIASSILFIYSIAIVEKISVKGTRSIRLISVICFLLFTPSLVSRFAQASDIGHSMAVPFYQEKSYIDYSKWLMSQETKVRYLFAQEHTPKDAKLLIWSVGSFHIDYRRNPIWDVDPSGFGAPWQTFPLEGSFEAQFEFFKAHDVRFIMWQYAGTDAGTGARTTQGLSRPNRPLRVKLNWGMICFKQFLNELSLRNDRSVIIYDDGHLKIIKLLTLETTS